MTTPNIENINGAPTERRVSKKFYAYLTRRVEESCRLLPEAEREVCDEALRLIDGYISTGEITGDMPRPEVMLIFTILRPEIDKAVSRSVAASRRAALKKAAREDKEQKEEKTDEIIETAKPEPIAEPVRITRPVEITVPKAEGADKKRRPIKLVKKQSPKCHKSRRK